MQGSARSEEVARALRDRLTRSEYRPGQWIREGGLQQEFGLSNGPVREALRQLASEGLLEYVPYRGVRVKALDDRELVELFEFRAGVLELAAELAASYAAPKRLAEAPALLRHLEGHQAKQENRLEGRLARWIVDCAGSRCLTDACAKVLMISHLYVSEAALNRDDRRDLVRRAKEVVGAIVSRDAPRARAEIRELTRRQLLALGLEMRLAVADNAAGESTVAPRSKQQDIAASQGFAMAALAFDQHNQTVRKR